MSGGMTFMSHIPRPLWIYANMDDHKLVIYRKTEH